MRKNDAAPSSPHKSLILRLAIMAVMSIEAVEIIFLKCLKMSSRRPSWLGKIQAFAIHQYKTDMIRFTTGSYKNIAWMSSNGGDFDATVIVSVLAVGCWCFDILALIDKKGNGQIR